MASNKETPMMRQYRRIKSELPPEVILFFRLGDFYEMFFEDAQAAAGIMDIALTKRNNVPMCGVPYHAAEQYLAKLVRAGKKVAICDQVEDPAQAKGIVKRELTRIVTPGTAVEDSVLDSTRNNFLAGVASVDGEIGLAVLDLSTGLLIGEKLPGVAALRDVIAKISPSECAAPASLVEDGQLDDIRKAMGGAGLSACEDWTFDHEPAYDFLTRHFGVRSLEGFGCEGEQAIVSAAGGILYYVKEDLHRNADHVSRLRVRNASDYLVLDETTCGNLDLVPLRGRDASVSLLKVMDVTRTAMGARLLRDWILRPLASADPIRRRHDAVEALCGDRVLLGELREVLGGVRDMERLIARLGGGGSNARDILAMGQSLSFLPTVKELVDGHSVDLIAELGTRIKLLPGLEKMIADAIVDEPPAMIKDGGVIRDGYNPELDEFRKAATEGREWLAEYQAGEQERTGIRNLKIRHNKVFGYYIEVSKAQLANVPDEYIRKQTLVNAERFITPELKEYENKVFGAHEKAVALEHQLLFEVRDAIAAKTADIQSSADAIAQLDVLGSFAERALAMNYVRPEICTDDKLVIREGRHPVIEQMADTERFVPNDATLDCSENQLIIITGPNMAGKSTYIRQVGLIVIMAQMGSFVPASGAEIGLVDRVFTRVGASDDLARGRSTFMVEMEETANILNNATRASLIVLDEIGRGTSTFDGISIAWAVAEYLHNNESTKAKTLFATHYHELTDLALTMEGVKNYNVLAREQNDTVVFLRKIVPGGADKSYGIQVARLAGLPDEVLDRAREILGNLEEGELGETGQPKIAKKRTRKGRHDPAQLSLFDG
ncbi:MAG: DNA mismatch repair protein MutS [Kiritimatiellia bacterium]|nr:DNA mismatch repair protein MutS [Kiritimatiellia bacterium]MDP6848892.1 DNA mismatch repair protein MutS [Kiritimatiellia bacterium]